MKKIDEKSADTILAALAIGHAVLVFINAYFRQQVDLLVFDAVIIVSCSFLSCCADGCRSAAFFKRKTVRIDSSFGFEPGFFYWQPL